MTSDSTLPEEVEQTLLETLMFEGYSELDAKVFVAKVIQHRDMVQAVIDLSLASGNPPPPANHGAGEEG